MEEDKKLPQVDESKETEQPGAVEQPQAGAEEAPKLRTYSQEEWSKRESEKDTEIGGLKNTLSQAAMRAQIAEQQLTETTAQAKDQNEVDQGLLTEVEAKQRQQERVRAIQAQPRIEAMGRLMAAQDFGERYGINPYELLNDKSIQTPKAMEAKAKEISQATSDAEKLKVSDEVDELKARIKVLEEGEPRFDRGQSGTSGASVDQMSAEDKVKYGLTHPKKT